MEAVILTLPSCSELVYVSKADAKSSTQYILGYIIMHKVNPMP